MARGKIVLEDPNGRQKKAPIGYSWLMFICGPLYPLFRGQFGHAVLSLLFVVPTIGFSWLSYPFFINALWRNALMNSGFEIVDIEDISVGELKSETGIDLDADIPGKGRIGARIAGFWATQSLLLVPLVSILVTIQEENRLAELRENDPQRYLEEIRGQEKYWRDLETLYPERYAIEWAEEQRHLAEQEKEQQNRLAEQEKEQQNRLAEQKEKRKKIREEQNAELVWEGELYSTNIPKGIYCSERYGGDKLDPHVMAHYFVTEHIKNNLVASASGNFPVIDYTAIYVNPCTYTIHSWFEGQNVFGAEMRRYYRATVKLEDDEDGGALIYDFRQGVRSRLLRK